MKNIVNWACLAIIVITVISCTNTSNQNSKSQIEQSADISYLGFIAINADKQNSTGIVRIGISEPDLGYGIPFKLEESKIKNLALYDSVEFTVKIVNTIPFAIIESNKNINLNDVKHTLRQSEFKNLAFNENNILLGFAHKDFVRSPFHIAGHFPNSRNFDQKMISESGKLNFANLEKMKPDDITSRQNTGFDNTKVKKDLSDNYYFEASLDSKDKYYIPFLNNKEVKFILRKVCTKTDQHGNCSSYIDVAQYVATCEWHLGDFLNDCSF